MVFLKCCEMSEKSNLGVYFPFGAWGKDAAAFKGFDALETQDCRQVLIKRKDWRRLLMNRLDFPVSLHISSFWVQHVSWGWCGMQLWLSSVCVMFIM